MSLKTINNQSPEIRDKMLSQAIGKYPMVKAPLIEPIGKTVDIYSTPNKKQYFIDDKGLLEYTTKEVVNKINYSEYRDIDSFVLKYIEDKNKYTKENTYLDKTSDNIFSKVTNPMLGYFLGETPALSISGNNHWDFSSSNVGDTISNLSVRVATGQETNIGNIGLRTLGVSLFNSVLDKTRRDDKLNEFLKKPLEIFNAIDELDINKVDLPTGLENFIGGYFPIYLYSEIKRDKGIRSYSDFSKDENDLNLTWSNSQDFLVNIENSEPEDYSDSLITNKNSLLYKTKQMFAKQKIKTIVDSVFNDNDTAYLTPRGSAISRKITDKNGPNVYFRTWSALNQYKKISELRSTLIDEEKIKLNNTIKRFRPDGNNILEKYGVLQDNGFVKVSPTVDDIFDDSNNKNVKKYMFSIENLAWKDSIDPFIDGTSQEGPNGGRIMWFPPYDIKFTDNTGVNIESNNFIGRGEPVYTYVNTERTGTIDFKLVVDSPSVIDIYNKENNVSDEDYHRLFKGVDILDISGKTVNTVTGETKQTPIISDPIPEKTYISKIYFPNNLSGVDFTDINKLFEYLYHGKAGNYDGGNGYEMIEGEWNGLNAITDTDLVGSGSNFKYVVDETLRNENVESQFIRNDSDSYSYKLNSETTSATNFTFKQLYEFFKGVTQNNSELVEIFKNIKRIEIVGYSSSHGTIKNNENLSKQRAKSVKKWFTQESIFKNFNNKINTNDITCKGDLTAVTLPDKNINTKAAKSGRYVEIKFVTGPTSENINAKDNNQKTNNTQSNVNTTTETTANNGSIRGKKDMYMFSATNQKDMVNDETKFFKNRNKNEDFIYKTYSEKIKYFHPAFHSTTPEGFNSRLTFLQQCTRQGPTGNNIGMATNMAFGRPPICVLRIGDFYNTKIMFDSLNITYEPLVWDLNPEGIGVQPMIANITMGFKFIGGSDLSGPIARLQNAITFNFFANTGVYDDRNDRVDSSGKYSQIYNPDNTK